MASEKSKKLLADRKATEEKAEADRIAAEAEAKRIADEATAAEAQRLAVEQAAAAAAADAAAAAEAQRLAYEQARQQQYVAPAPVAPAPVAPVAPAPPVYYKNCTEARNAGAAPVYAGGPGYGRHLDRDGDGIGCEK